MMTMILYDDDEIIELYNGYQKRRTQKAKI